MYIHVTSTLDGLERDLRTMSVTGPVEMAKLVRKDAIEGNRIARAFASQQHTMNSAIDVPYQESFSAEKRGPLTWAYGPVDDGVPHGGSQATGYEFGSINQPPHLDLARSVDIIGPRFASDARGLLNDLFWPGA